MAIPFIRELEFSYGEPRAVTPLIRRVVAHNPSSFTFKGTGTYIVGKGQVAVIDPGPALPAHIDALMNAVRGETISHIVVTHTHVDHSPGAAALQKATGAPSYGFGPHPRHGAGVTTEQGGDLDFAPDHVIGDGDVIAGKGWTLEAVHTPGHLSNHLCFGLREEKILFSGDHVMGWSTSVISPPDGNMTAYMNSLDKLLTRDDRMLIPTHGAEIKDPKPFVRAFIEHRHAREDQIMQCLKDGIATIPAMVKRMYRDVDPGLHAAAARSVLAHIGHMIETGRVKAEGPLTVGGSYRAA